MVNFLTGGKDFFIIEYMDIKKRMERLAAELFRHQHLYYIKSAPEISDSDYDRLFDELLELERKYPDFTQVNSPSKRIGSDLDNTFPERQHTVPVLSLDKEYTLDHMDKWLQKSITNAGQDIGFVVEEKIDGASIILYFNDGKLNYALTRGNGLAGNDVSDNVRTIAQIPLVIPQKSNFAVRGEIFIKKSDFCEFNKQFDNKYANPRNLAAGSLRNLKSSLVAKVPLNIFIYEGFFQEEKINDHILLLLKLKEMGFRINTHTGFFSQNQRKNSSIKEKFPEITTGNLKDLISFIKLRMKERDTLDYEIDGLVIKINEIDVRNQLGHTSHHPRWAMAFKFDSPTAQTQLLEIHIQVGRNGRIAPVAILQPIKIAGSLVGRATLHNQEYIEMLELGIGDQVSISKRGDIIPAVEEVLEKDSNSPIIYKYPTKCPFCQTVLIKDGAHHFCKNRDCPERIRRTLIHFTSKKQMDINTLGEKTMKFLFNRGFIKRIPDIYLFNYDRLIEEEGFKEKKISNIKESVEKSKARPFHKVLTALGFDGLGEKAVSELIRNGFSSIEKIIDGVKKGDAELFSSLEGFGDISAHMIIKHFTQPENLKLIQDLQQVGLNFIATLDKTRENEKIFANQTWVLTGTFKYFIPRTQAVEAIEKRGGRVSNAVSAKTTTLLAGEFPGSKLAKARQLGVAVIDEDEFVRLLKKGD